MAGARGLLINITGGDDLTLFEVDQAANRIREEVDDDANVIFGSAIDESLTGRVRVSVVATGIDSPRIDRQRPPLTVVTGGAVPQPPAALVRQHEDEAQDAPEPVMATMTEGNTVRQIAPRPIVTPRMQMAAAPDAIAEPAPGFAQPVLHPQPIAPMLRQHQAAVPHARPELFADAARPASQPPVSAGAPLATPPAAVPAPADPVGNGLFRRVTGVFRRPSGGSAPAPAAIAPNTERRAPVMTPVEPDRPATRPAQAQGDGGIEIPTFLRRQTS
jgi:cell division protein FtsZ